MISIVCVYSDEEILRDVLIKSLQCQTAEYELITIDNRQNIYRSAAEALNHGGEIAKGHYIMFVHQDVRLGSDCWLEEAERTLTSVKDLGVAGIAGQAERGNTWAERCRWSIGEASEFLGEDRAVQSPEEVQTLDKCLLIVPKPVFGKLQFDDKTF